MATYTPNLNLKKPAGTDYVRVSDFNDNANVLDASIGDLVQLQTTEKTNLVLAINEAKQQGEHLPYVDETTKTWWVWNASLNQYEDSEESAKGVPGVSVTVGTTTTGAAGTQASVSNSGTESDAVLNFTIPQGPTGNGIASVTLISGTHAAGTSDTYRITYTNAETYDFLVYNGADGNGIGDMLKSVYDTDDDGVVDSAETLSGLTASVAELNYVDGTTSAIQTQLNARLPLAGGTMTGALNEALVSSMALAGTMNIGAAAGNYIIVTAGTGPITAFDVITMGARRTLRFSVSATITYNATSMLLPGAADLSVVAGDVLTFVSGGSGIWRCTNIQRWGARLDDLAGTGERALFAGATGIVSAKTASEALSTLGAQAALSVSSATCTPTAVINAAGTVRKYGKVVTYSFVGTLQSTPTAETAITQIPSGFRPSYELYFVIQSAAAPTVQAFGYIDTSGYVYIRPDNNIIGSGVPIGAATTYIVS